MRDEHGRPEVVVPNCPYCDRRLGNEPTRDGMHATCYVQFGVEMVKLHPETSPPQSPEFFGFPTLASLHEQAELVF